MSGQGRRANEKAGNAVAAEGRVAAEGHDAANGQVAEGQNATKGQVAAEGQNATEGQVAAEGQDVAEGLIVAVGQFAVEGQFAAKGQETLNNQLKLGIGVIRHRNCLVVLYSLTKNSAIFAEVKGYFGITAPDNQLGPMSWFFLKSNNQLECLESGWSKLCSLRNQY